MSDKGPVIVSLHVEAGRQSWDHEARLDRATWDEMPVSYRLEWLERMADDHAANHVGWGWHVDNPEDYADTQSSDEGESE